MVKNREERRKVAARSWAEQKDQGMEPTAVKLPEGVHRFAPKKDDTYELDIIPYVVGKGNPGADEGMIHFERTFFVHWLPSLSGGNRSYCCLAKTFKKKCPVCEYIRTAPESIAKDMKDKTRMLFRVIDRNDTKKGIQVWETPYFKGFGEMLKNKLKGSKKGRYDNFYELSGGMTLEVSIGDGNMGERTFKTVTNLEIVTREEDYPEDYLDAKPNLDECLMEMSYADLKAILEGEASSEKEDEEEDDEPVTKTKVPSKNGKSSPKEEEEEDDDNEEDDEDDDKDTEKHSKKEETADSLGIKVGSKVEYDDNGVCEVKEIKKDRKTLVIETDDGDIYRPDVSEVTLVKGKASKPKDEEDEEEAPKRGPGRPKKAKEEDEEEEEPPVKRGPGRPRKGS